MKSSTGRSPWPGKLRKCRDHCSRSISIRGASASCTKVMRSAGMARIGSHGQAPRERRASCRGSGPRADGRPGARSPRRRDSRETCRPQASASKPMSMPNPSAISPSSRRSAAARSMPPSEAGETLEQIRIAAGAELVHQLELALRPLEAARALRLGHALEVAERLEGDDLEPVVAHHAARSPRGEPSCASTSASKISTPSKPAAAIAASFSVSEPPSETVAIENFMPSSSALPQQAPRRSAAVEDLEGVQALVEVELVPAHHRKPLRRGVAQELRVDRRIDRVEGPLPRRAISRARHRRAVVADHADRRAVDQARPRPPRAAGDVAGHRHRQPGRRRAQRRRQRLGLRQVALDQLQLARARGRAGRRPPPCRPRPRRSCRPRPGGRSPKAWR